MFVSITRLRLHSLRFLPQFFAVNERSIRQVLATSGFISGKLLIAGPREFWTVTLWADERSMRNYRGARAHLAAMGRLADWCDEASVAHWFQESGDLPGWQTIHQRMQDSGRRSRVGKPSREHQAERWIVPPPGWRLERSLRSKER